MRRSNRRVVKAGAAASIVLTFSPGLIAPSAAPATTVRPPANLRTQLVPEDDDSAGEEFRAGIRLAARDRASARGRANEAFRLAVEPHRRLLAARLAAATSNVERRAARVAYGEAILPAKVARKVALQDARVAYIEAVEQARVDFLKARDADTHVVASANFRQAVNVATAEYRAAVGTAQGHFKSGSAPIRVGRRGSLRDSPSEHERSLSEQSLRLEVADVTGVFRSQVSTARASYQAKISLARRMLSASLAT